MAISRMTQKMMSDRALLGMQAGLDRLSKVQEQLTTGRVINRPSDDPTATTSAMRIRGSVAAQKQYARNANDALAWLNQTDATLASMTDQVRRAKDIALQGANDGAMGPEAREALATEVDQIRKGLIATANGTYLGRPLFGGVTGGSAAYAADGTWIGVPAAAGQGVTRTVGEGVQIRVDVEGPTALGPDGDSLFDHLDALATALRSGSSAGMATAIGKLGSDSARITDVQSSVGARTNRVEQAQTAAGDAQLSLTNSLSEIENADIAKATVDLQLQEVAYQAALSATARVMQPSLLDFLR
ncbi:flagellar hook-associated protein FlgL [Nocardioides aquiterrae]|uniref:Flagellar hook-associated protein FlgL n=1 Tax=Nocardioides aquiterrae TaxID=203799 RepID=A0ABP4EZW9_9ACTN